MTINNNCFRLAQGGRIDRGRPLRFKFNGRKYQGFQGDTLASALLANGVKLLGRSFKYHRPRGIMSAGLEETNAVVQLCGRDDEPNALATTIQLQDGLEARSVNCWPGVKFDVGVLSDILHIFFPASFYYKTFMWPNNWWKYYAYFIRRAAGLGRAPERYDLTERYEKRYWHCDVLIVGAGPAGLAAALAAGRCGARVLLVDNQRHPGGSLVACPDKINRLPALQWVQETIKKLDTMPEMIRLQEAVAVGYFDHNMVYVSERNPDKSWLRERLWRVRAKRVIHATGSIERPLVFADNDRPGVMLASSAVTYLKQFAVKAGHHAVVVTNNNSAYHSAFTLAGGGIAIRGIVDIRQNVRDELAGQAADCGIEVFTATTIVKVRGRRKVSGVEVAPLGDLSRRRALKCDLICVAGGWSPSIHLQSQSGAAPIYDEVIAAFVPGNSVQLETTVGAARGSFQLNACLEEGHTAGAEAASATGHHVITMEAPISTVRIDLEIEPLWELPHLKPTMRAFVDYQNDITTKDVKLAMRENFASAELVKRFTTAGMGIDQGKTGNVNTIGVIAQASNKSPGEIGTTTYRPMVCPVSFAALSGMDRDEIILPARRSPITGWLEGAGAYMSEAALLYRRPYCLPGLDEKIEAAIQREALAARKSIAIYDGATLGKFELRGGDAGKFLNLVYTNSWETLDTGRGQFGMMLREDGTMFDDGVCFRLEKDHWFMFCSSGGVSKVHAWLEQLLQCEWPDFDVFLTDVSEQWANVCICGPNARKLLVKAGTDIDLDKQSFPFMGIREGKVAGFDARVARVGFTGELSFEINVRARDGLSLWTTLMDAGKEFDITPIGTEAVMLLRLEKGFIIPAIEGDGYANPYDAGMDWVINPEKTDFVGKYALGRAQATAEYRPHIVGLLPADKQFVPPDGAPLVDLAAKTESSRMIGHVTAGGFSPHLQHSIALAQLDNGRERIGDSVNISVVGKIVPAHVTEPIFFDKTGARMRC